MLKSLRTFCHDQRGTLLTTEWAIIATILVLGAFSYVATQHTSAWGERSALHRNLD